jgi:hypothetical protein
MKPACMSAPVELGEYMDSEGDASKCTDLRTATYDAIRCDLVQHGRFRSALSTPYHVHDP